jgi:hypothetical protein
MARSSRNWEEKAKALWPYALMIGVGILSYFIASYSTPDLQWKKTAKQQVPSISAKPDHLEETKSRRQLRDRKVRSGEIVPEDGAIPYQSVISFKDKAAMDAFLAKLNGRLSLLGRIDQLHTLLIGFDDENDLPALLDGSEEKGAVFPVFIPDFGTKPQAGAEALGDGLLEWLGVNTDHSQWGKGIKIAILDTGIAEHAAFKVGIEHINLVDLPSDLSQLNGHGTAVASLIFSNDPSSPGIAPSATPLSVRIADDNGTSNSFLIAKGIMAAVDAGATLINISMGGMGQSSLVSKALAYAEKSGVMVIAAAGNSGTQGVMQPAAHPSVIAVGAVDANNQSMNFSNTGNKIAVSAPGYKVNAAYPGNARVSATGTSFSAPIFTGTVAATMSQGSARPISPQAAYDTVKNNLRDIGIPGHDFQTGDGIPDLGRIMSRTGNTRDVAINSITRNGNQAYLIVQNLGSQTMVNTGVFLNVNGLDTQQNITTLLPGATQVISIPLQAGQATKIRGNLRTSGNQSDQRPHNNSYSLSIPGNK